MIVGAVHLIKSKIGNSYLQLFYILYCGWFIYLIISGFNLLTDYAYLKTFLFNPAIGLVYFAPLLLLFPKDQYSLNRLFDFILICGVIYLLLDLVFIKQLLTSDRSSTESQDVVEAFSSLSLPSSFVLLTFNYHHTKRRLLALLIVLVALTMAVIRARRGLIFMYSNILILSAILFTAYSRLKLMIFYIALFLGCVVALYINNSYKINQSRVFGYLLERADEDTRSGVEYYFYNDMKFSDWIVGRGIDGKYFCPDVEEYQPTNYRSFIETGYLQTILKGGIISLALFLLIAIPAAIKGIFYSKNAFSKAAGLWIVTSIVDLYPAIVNSFTLQYLLVWICIGICYSKEFRYQTNDEEILNTKHLEQ